MSTALGAAAPAAAQDVVKWRQSPIIFLPSEVRPGQQMLNEGDLIVSFPLRWVFSTRLAQDVTLDHDGESVTLEAGSLLPRVVLLRNGVPQEETVIFCTRSRVAEAREGTGLLGALVGNWFNGLMDAQTCLEDNDKDGVFDRAMVLGEGDAIIDLGPVGDVAYEELVAESMGTGEDVAQITLSGVGRSRIHLAFNIFQRGEARDFSTMQSNGFTASRYNTIRYGEEHPGTMDLLGVRIQVMEADRKEDRALLAWRPVARSDDFVVVPDNVEVTYGY